MVVHENKFEVDEAIKAMRRKLYARARRYWQSVGDEARLKLTDDDLDEQFWLIDPEGIPRLKSEEGTIELPENPLLKIARMAEANDFRSIDSNVVERSREILNTEFPEYLMRRMRGQDPDAEPDSD